MKSKLFTLLLFCFALLAQAQIPHTVWENPRTGYNSHSHVFSITKVKMGDERTEVTMHVNFRPKHWIKMASTAYLQVGDKHYPIRKNMPMWGDKGTTLLELDKEFFLDESGQLDFVCVFDALPQGTEHFDLIEPAGWQITNIRPGGITPQGIADTYWRNEATGDWLIGFAEKHAIYNNRVWDILSQTQKKDRYELLLSDGKSQLSVRIDKMKKGKRNISIDGAKALSCSPIITEYLPDYPTRDDRAEFADNGYRANDSVTICGWLKDMPELAKKQNGGTFRLALRNLLADEQELIEIPLDLEGRFYKKLPLLNTSDAITILGNNSGAMVLEPGQTYFLLHDFKTAQTLIMGDDVRMQNELLAHDVPYIGHSTHELEKEGKASEEQLMNFLAEGMQKFAKANAELDSLIAAHPNLSQRYINYARGAHKVTLGGDLMQARFCTERFDLPKAYVDHVSKEFWMQHGKPYTLHGGFCSFMRDYVDVCSSNGKDQKVEVLALIKKMASCGDIALTEDELSALDQFMIEGEKLKQAVEATEDSEQKKAIVDAFNNGELVKTINTIVGKYQFNISTELRRIKMEHGLDSVATDKTIHELFITRELYSQIENNRRALPKSLLEWMQRKITIPAFRDYVLQQHEKYDALARKDFSNSTSLLSTDNLEGMTEGEQILRELVAPWKGKIILVDVWGTWCGPCKMAMKHSQELYERMKPYNMYFLYLANRSDDTSWKNVIKEYNVNGENVGHVNLPVEQQEAVERFLKVNKYPSYFLIDREGHLLDVNADPRNMDAFEELVKGMGK